jgi:hypothetical protein
MALLHVLGRYPLLSVPALRRPRRDIGRWETIRYALDSNARTFRLCLILLVTTVSPVVAAVVAVLIRHMLLCLSGVAAPCGQVHQRRRGPGRERRQAPGRDSRDGTQPAGRDPSPGR